MVDTVSENPLEPIDELELRIEELREAIARSRRLILAGRACVVIAPALLVCFLLGLVTFTPVRMIIAIIFGVGGMILMGSSRASTEELMRSLKRTEDERRAAIDALELVEVRDLSTTPPGAGVARSPIPPSPRATS